MLGKFITIEGIEGVGKSTLIDNIASYLSEKKTEYIITKEPGGTQLGQKIRELLFDSNQNIDAISELLLLFADRNQHYKELIKPNLKKGKIVLSDRFVDSTYAYQGAGRGIDLDLIKQLELICYGDFKPDLVLWLDLDEKLAFERVAKRKEVTNRFEQEKLDFFIKARNLFKQRHQSRNYIHRIDASESIEKISKNAINAINEIFQTNNK